MEFLDLAKKRYSCRKYKSDKVEEEKINKILEAARLAPTAANNQPCRILTIQSEEGLEKMKKVTNFTFDAPLVFVVFSDLRECWYHPFEDLNSVSIDPSIVATHMTLEAADLDLGSLMILGYSPSFLGREFDVPPYLFPNMILAVGYEAEDSVPNPRHESRKEIEEFTYYESF